MNLFSDSMQSMEELLRKSKKVKRGASLDETEIDGAWLTAYARIARRRRDDKDLGVSRYTYELAPGVSPSWADTSSIASGRSVGTWSGILAFVLLFEYEAHYTNSAGYWMSLSSTAMDLSGEALKIEGTTGVEEAERLDV
jgi:hypothetical protein